MARVAIDAHGLGRPGGKSGVQDALRHGVEWHEGVGHSENADLEVATAAGSAGEYLADETPSAHALLRRKGRRLSVA